MGNDNWDRTVATKGDLVSLEEKVNELYGPGIFDWTIGKVGIKDADLTHDPGEWFYYGGHDEDMFGKPKWKVGGHAPTIVDALIELIRQYTP